MMTQELAVRPVIDISKLSKTQMRAWGREQDKARMATLLSDGGQKGLDLLKLMLSQPITTALAAMALTALLGKARLLDKDSVSFFQGMIMGAGTIEIFVGALNPFD